MATRRKNSKAVETVNEQAEDKRPCQVPDRHVQECTCYAEPEPESKKGN